MGREKIMIQLKDGPVTYQEVYEGINDDEHGAQAVFMGTVRNRNHCRNVLSVDYDAFRPLTIKVFRAICEEGGRWNLAGARCWYFGSSCACFCTG